MTVTLPIVLPATPVHVTEYAVFEYNIPVPKDPVVPVPPPPVDEHDVAFVEVQVTVDDPP